MKALPRKFTLFMLAIMITLIIPVQAQEDLEEQTFLLTFIPNIQFAPMYITIADGYFAEAGFDVSLEYLNEPDVIDLIAADQRDFGVVSGEQVIIAASRARPITYVYEWFQQYPIGVVVPNDSDIATPEDLTGLPVGVPGRFGATYSGLTTLLSFAEMSESDIELNEIGFAAPEVFCLGAVQAAAVYINNEPLQIRNRAQQGDCNNVQDVTVIPVGEYVDLVSNGIITSQKLVEEQPEKVQAFVSAYDAGLNAVINNPAQAYLTSLDFVESLPISDEMITVLTELATAQEEFLATDPSREDIATSRADMLVTLQETFSPDDLLQFEILLASVDLWDAERTGYSDLASWENMLATLVDLDILGDEVELEAIFTNDFVADAE